MRHFLDILREPLVFRGVWIFAIFSLPDGKGLPVMFGNCLSQCIDRQTGAMQVVCGQPTHFVRDIFRLKLQGLLDAAARCQRAHGATARHGVNATLRYPFYLFKDIVLDHNVHFDLVTAASDADGAGGRIGATAQIAWIACVLPKPAVGRYDR